MENQVLQIIDMLYAMIAEAWGVPLGNDKCIVERDKALGLLDDQQSVLRAAQQRAEETVRNAEEKSRELRRVASNYLDDALRQTEETVAAALESVRTARSQFKAVSAPEPVGRSDVTLNDVEDIDLLGQ